MGTKNNPAAYDCYAQAEPDEPMFVLLGRDGDAPGLVELWAKIREEKGEDPDKVREARQCAEQMREWRLRRRTLANANAEALALVEMALRCEGGHHKQWYLAQLIETLGGKVPVDIDVGVAP